MINFIITCDNLDVKLGQYFKDCSDDFHNFISENTGIKKNCEQINSEQTYFHYVNKTINQYNNSEFIFIVYTHGNEHSLGCNGIPYVSSANSHLFRNSLFYSTACLAGKRLAPKLIEDNCHVFIGYKNESFVFEKEGYKNIFINGDNFAIKLFLIKDISIGDAFKAMKEYYTTKIDYFLEIREDPVFISALADNREALICLGNKELKKDDFFKI